MKRLHLLIILLFYPIFIFAHQGEVVTAQHLATQVGVDVLQKGGNAVDAAVAVGYALVVVNPCCGNVGGGGFMLIRFADGRDVFVNFREKAPLAAHPQLFLNAQGDPDENKLAYGYLAVGVPGTVLGLNTALKKYGTFSLKKVLQPAIRLAKQGFELAAGDIEILNQGNEKFKEQSNVAKIFLNNGKPYQVGDRLVQTDLSRTLTLLASCGENIFYRGKIAAEIVAASKANHGILTQQDFANYTIKEQRPITCNYRGYTVITSPPPASGVTVCEMLNIAENYPLNHYGFHTPLSTHFMLEAMRYAYADRNRYLGDPERVKIPVCRLIAKQHAKQISHKILMDKAGNSQQISMLTQSHEGHNTTSYVIVDKAGNAVSVTYTLNSYFGAKVIADETGFFLNNELDDFTIVPTKPNSFGLIQGVVNLIAPGKRPLSAMSPTILLKNNKLFLVLGTPGGSTIPTQLVQTIQNIVDFKMSVQDAVNMPRFHFQWLPDVVYVEPGALPPDTQMKLQNMGYKITEGSPWGAKQWGAVTAILKDPKTGLLMGAMDGRKSAGKALGTK